MFAMDNTMDNTMDKTNKAFEMLCKPGYGKNLLDGIISISKGISRQYKQHEEVDPVLGLSCNPYQSDITYATFEKIQKEEKVVCCESPGCKMVEETDLNVWLGKNVFIRALSKNTSSNTA